MADKDIEFSLYNLVACAGPISFRGSLSGSESEDIDKEEPKNNKERGEEEFRERIEDINLIIYKYS